MSKPKDLIVIMPTTKGIGAIPSIKSALGQVGFSQVKVVICGKSTTDHLFLAELKSFLEKGYCLVAGAKDKTRIMPGEARNGGLDLLKAEGLSPDYILFLDDDIVIPEDYSKTLVAYLEAEKAVAVIGGVTSRPVNYWTKIIDYSNFWWLQMDQSVKRRGFMGAGATVMSYKDIVGLRFNKNAAVNEDTLFFMSLARKTKKPLSYCADTRAEHNHGRNSFSDFARYQFRNGMDGVRFRGTGLNFYLTAKKVWRTFRHAYRGNQTYLRAHKKIALGVLMSFGIFQLGIEWGELKRFLRKMGKRVRTKK